MGSFLFLVLQQSGNDRYPRWNSELSICGGPGQGLPQRSVGEISGTGAVATLRILLDGEIVLILTLFLSRASVLAAERSSLWTPY